MLIFLFMFVKHELRGTENPSDWKRHVFQWGLEDSRAFPLPVNHCLIVFLSFGFTVPSTYNSVFTYCQNSCYVPREMVSQPLFVHLFLQSHKWFFLFPIICRLKEEVAGFLSWKWGREQLSGGKDALWKVIFWLVSVVRLFGDRQLWRGLLWCEHYTHLSSCSIRVDPHGHMTGVSFTWEAAKYCGRACTEIRRPKF